MLLKLKKVINGFGLEKIQKWSTVALKDYCQRRALKLKVWIGRQNGISKFNIDTPEDYIHFHCEPHSTCNLKISVNDQESQVKD